MPAGSSSGGGSARDVRAGGAYYELALRDRLSAALDKVQGKVKSFGQFMSRIGNASLGAGAALGAGPLALLLGGTSRLADTARLARQFQAPIEVMNRLQYAAERAGVSIEEVANDTKGRFADLLAQAPGIDPRQAQQALQIQNAWKDAIRSLQDAILQFLPTITDMVQTISNLIQKNPQFIRTLAEVAVGLVAFGAAAKGAGIALRVLSLFMSPGGIILAGLTGIGAALVALSGKWDEYSKEAQDAFGAIVTAVTRGDLEAAFEVATSGLKVIWIKFSNWITNLWQTIIDRISEKLADLWDSTRSAWGVMIEKATGSPFRPAMTGDVLRDMNAKEAAARVREAEAELAAARAGYAAAKGKAIATPAPAAGRVMGRDEAAAADFGWALERQLLEIARKGLAAADSARGSFATPVALQQFGYNDKLKQLTEINKQQLIEQVRQTQVLLQVAQGLFMR